MSECDDAQRATVRDLLADVKVIFGVRRQSVATGVSPLPQVLKSDFTEYPRKKPEVYVDFKADAIAEPSDPLRTVDMLKELPCAMSELYRVEDEVLKGGVDDPDVLSDIDGRYRRVVGHHREWRKYLHRPECEHLWSCCPYPRFARAVPSLQC